MATSSTSGVLIAYDGSRPAQNAIAHAARLFPGSPALVATVWRSVRPAAGAARAALPDDIIDQAVHNLDATAQAEASRTAEDGAERARSAGMSASPLVICAEPSVWASIIAAADTYDARAVVVGSRGRSGLRSALLGSVSNAVVHHCRRPVVVVHPADGEELMAPDNANAAARHSGSR
jgi:nucleotide-binding universal stress UspA family protein